MNRGFSALGVVKNVYDDYGRTPIAIMIITLGNVALSAAARATY